jgi:hypothetical protein
VYRPPIPEIVPNGLFPLDDGDARRLRAMARHVLIRSGMIRRTRIRTTSSLAALR